MISLLATAMSSSAAGELFGPTSYARPSGTAEQAFTATFTVPEPSTPIYLDVRNGEVNGSGRLTNVEVRVNGLLMLDAQAFAGGAPGAFVLISEAIISRPNSVNRIDVTLGGSTAGTVSLTVRSELDPSQPPPPPVLDAPPSITRQPTVMLTGSASGATSVRVSGPPSSFPGPAITVPVVDGFFEVTVPLAQNRSNPLSVVALSAAQVVSSPANASIIQDMQGPSLAIDVPTAAAGIANTATDVAGRVSDALSGFNGLTVTVNGLPAAVNIGIGTNGTFFRSNIPLTAGAPTAIEVIARDSAGNTTTRLVSVNRVEIDPDAPRMEVISGNAQTAPMMGFVPNPIVVKVTRPDGSPIANKFVTFKVARSDGRLAGLASGDGSMMLQAATDGMGIAKAYWRLGSDAGMGNNRVEVTSNGVAGTIGFCASATPGQPKQISIGSGGYQRAESGAQAPEPIRAWVNDGCNGIAGIPVTFVVRQGFGRVNGSDRFTVNTGPTGHASCILTLGAAGGLTVVEATFPNNPGQPASFVAFGVRRDQSQTSFAGMVLDNADRPLGGATLILNVSGQQFGPITSDAGGKFAFPNLGTAQGPGTLDVTGMTIATVGGQAISGFAGLVFPPLTYTVNIVANAANEMPSPVLLPPLELCNTKCYSQTQDTIMTVRRPVTAGGVVETSCVGGSVRCDEIVPGLKMTIKAGSMRVLNASGVLEPAPNGTHVALNLVHIDNIPMPFPDGAYSPLAWTVKPPGAHFDPPIAIEMPNMAGLPAGAVVNILNFDHDTERFEIVGTGTVSTDGSSIKTDPGSGLAKSGWGGFCPPYPDTGGADDDGDDTDDDMPDEDMPKPGSDSSPGAPTQESCGDDGTDSGADPIYFFSGEFYEEVEDMRIKGRGLDFVWARKYRSKSDITSPQGNNWDSSYNVFIESMGQNLSLCQGNGRKDVYRRQANGTWSTRGFFREITSSPDGTFVTKFSDGGEWQFAALDGTPQAGKMIRSSDRNGNTMRFAYDAQGRLSIVTDTLDRPITIAYDSGGRVRSVTDFAGRQVTYSYYGANDAGGSLGDLKSVTTPAVTGTPHGNDFPNGKTTVYTYTKGFADDRLNHNLLTITDAKGQRYLTNVYASTTDPNNINFDRVTRQVWGNPTDIVDLTYVRLNGNPATAQPVIKVIVRDRAGNVKEYFYNRQNVATALREYTGRALTTEPTTETSNRPTGKLRATDPDFYETRYEWNNRFLMTRKVFPNGASESYYYESDINPNASARTEGNLRYKIRRNRTEDQLIPAAVLPTPAQTQLVEYFEYDIGLGSCCGSNFVTRHVDARGNSTTHQYDDKGNRIRTVHRLPQIVEDWSFNTFGQLTSHTHPANGSGHRRVDTMEYHASGPQRGYLAREIVDNGGLSLTTQYEYDLVGNVIRVIDPRGNDTLLTVNQLDQVVRRTSRPATTSAGSVRYAQDVFYDENNNIVRIDVLNVDAAGLIPANTHYTSLFEHDILNYVLRKAEETGEINLDPSVRSPSQLTPQQLPGFIVTEYGYDANRNRAIVRMGEATAGRDPLNTILMRYDERDLLLEEVRAPSSPSQSTTSYSYDHNKNLRERATGLELTPRRHYTLFDGFDRLVARIDPMGNATTYTLDPNGNAVTEITTGELDDSTSRIEHPLSCVVQGVAPATCTPPSPPTNPVVRLRESARTFDAMDRPTVETARHFDAFANPTGAQPNIGDGASTRTIDYAPNSQVTRTINDNNRATTTTYDTANRRRLMTDARGNTVQYSYDANSNVILTTRTDLDGLGGPPQVFTTTNAFDALDRLLSTTDNVGNINTFQYDSRNNRAIETDALGNRVIHAFDGASRLIATTRELRAGGIGTGSLIGSITTMQEWDASNRLRAQIDDNGNRTEYAYDALDRMVSERAGDGTLVSFVLDVHGNRIRTTDANGNVITTQYDLANRPIRRDIAVAQGVSNQTTFETFKYDGLSRVIQATDDDSVVTRAYDSLGYAIREVQNGLTIACVYDGMGNLTRCTYPSGRVITRTFDELERARVIADAGGGGVPAGPIATYTYVGPDRVARRDNGNGTRADFTYDGITGVPNPTGDFGVRRITRTRHTVASSGTVIDDKTYTWDRMFNKTSRRDQRTMGGAGAGVLQTFGYDSIYRLVRSESTAASPVLSGKSGSPLTDDITGNVPVVTSADGSIRNLPSTGTLTGQADENIVTSLPGSGKIGPRGPPQSGLAPGITEYFFDGVGNRTQVTGADNPGPYTLSPSAPEPADRQVNQYTTTPQDSRAYDRNGNLIQVVATGGTRTIAYDYRNRMVSMLDAAIGTSGAYAYDALGRRIVRAYDLGALGGNAGPKTIRYYYHGWQIAEERDAANAVQATYVYGNYIDEPITMRRGGVAFWYHQDDLSAVVAITNLGGSIHERATYGDYGTIAVFAASGAPSTLASSVSSIGFSGRDTDAESSFMWYRTRYLSPDVGRFASSDRVGTWGDALALGNRNAFVGNAPLTWRDAFGLTPESGEGACYVHFPDMPIDTGMGFTSTNLGGHAGTLTYRGDGSTQYREYGRYSSGYGSKLPAEDGNLRRVPLPNLKVGPDGRFTQDSVKALEDALRRKAGKNTDPKLTCSKKYDPRLVEKYLDDLASNPDRPKYDWTPWSANHCRSVANDALDAGVRKVDGRSSGSATTK